MWGFVAAVAIVAILAAALLSRPRRHGVEEMDSAQAELAPALARFIAAVNSENDRSSPAYVRAVELLKASSEKVLADAEHLLSDASDSSFAIRHSTLLALGALREPAALDLLSHVALNPQPLPPKRDSRLALNPQPQPPVNDPRSHRHGIRDRGARKAGTILSLAALDGIEALADDGVAAAVEVLVGAAAVESNAIRAVALAALAARPERREQLERASSALPAELHHLAQSRHVRIEEVPQVKDPRVHLAGTDADSEHLRTSRMEPRSRGQRAFLDVAPPK